MPMLNNAETQMQKPYNKDVGAVVGAVTERLSPFVCFTPTRLFALCMQASRPKIYCMGADHWEHETAVAPGYTLACSEDEAVGIGIRLANERWPIQDQWVNHICLCLEIPLPI
jgi:hypothetical protein